MENENVSETSGTGESSKVRVSPSARKLAERYGVAPEVMEEIISDTRSQTRIRPAQDVPVTPAASARPAQSASTLQTAALPVAEVGTPQPTVAPAASPVVNNVVSMPTATEAPKEPEHGMSIGAVILGMLLILALVLFFYFRPWGETTLTRQVDTVRVAMQPAPKDTAVADVLPPMDTVDHSLDQAPPRRHSRPRHKKVRARSHFYTTSSNLQAQEHLADLKASGNSRAYLETIHKGGSTYYRLHSNSKGR